MQIAQPGHAISSNHLIGLLPSLLGEDGVGDLMQLSILGQQRTQTLLERRGMTADVVEFSPFPFSPLFAERKAQIERVEQLWDAYHLKFGGDDMMVAYLLRVRRAQAATGSDVSSSGRSSSA